MYQDNFEDDDLMAEVELITQARYSDRSDVDDRFDTEVIPSQATTSQIPDVVRNFILHFHRNVIDNNVHELHSIYDSSFNRITEKFYRKQPWPDAEVVAPLVKDDQIFLTLYRELYYRHIYSHLTPTLDQRFQSYENYCNLFNYILNSNGPVSLELPNQWLWDIIDEFIYQFQSYCNFRERTMSKTDAESVLIEENSQIWSCYSVLNVLYSIIRKSCIKEQLLASKNGSDMTEAAGEYGSHSLYKMLGYFSIIGLLRVHCLLGDYVLALKMMDNIVLNKKSIFSRVAACHVTTCYYVGFAYMMIRRYTDAIKAFSTVLSFIQRTKQYHSCSYQFDQIAKKGDQMYALLAICIALCPTRLDENIHSQLREKYGEQLFKMQKDEGAIAVYTDLFQFACPKFVSPTGKGAGPYQYQLKVFLSDIKTQIHLPSLRSFMKLYSSMGIEKLAKFLEVDSDELKTQLLIFKQKSRQYKWVDGNLLDGEYLPTSDLDFCLKQDVVHIAESKVGRRYADWFLRNINRCEDILANMELNKA